MSEEKKYLYGPVPSRRLGRSLGIDIVPLKVCSLDCVYCQLGKTTNKSVERKDFIVVEDVLTELKKKLAKGIRPDYITIGGSGEPTLNSQLGRLIDGIRKITDIPIAVLTNGTLLYQKDVRDDCAKADVVLPSLDAADELTFQKINRPHGDISIEKLISGLIKFRDEFSGQIWLEVFLVKGINTTTEHIALLKKIIERIRPDKVQLNTAVRPAADLSVKRPDAKTLKSIAKQLGKGCEIIADFSPRLMGKHIKSTSESVLSMLRRRPCSLDDICFGLGIHHNEALKIITALRQQGLINSEEKDGAEFFKAG